MRFPVKEALVAASLVIGGGVVVERVASLGASPSLIVYAAMYAALALGRPSRGVCGGPAGQPVGEDGLDATGAQMGADRPR